jgi:hypothetical protein
VNNERVRTRQQPDQPIAEPQTKRTFLCRATEHMANCRLTNQRALSKKKKKKKRFIRQKKRTTNKPPVPSPVWRTASWQRPVHVNQPQALVNNRTP